MGRHDVSAADGAGVRTFTRALLRDLQALERMLAEGLIESGVRRFGAEQELFLVNRGWRPAPVAIEVLDRLGDGAFVTELARFNLEFNLDPHELVGACFRHLQTEIDTRMAEVRRAAAELGCDAVLTGILPTLGKSDLTLDNMTPKERYYALNEAMNRMRGGSYRLRIIGIDDLNIEHDSVMLEACNTSAQVHLQVEAEEFATFYNVAQAVTGPVLAACVNSPLLFGKRLWSETRIALFQQSLDTRSTTLHMRELQPRVRFGERWLRESVTELFEDDIAHFRVLLATEIEEDPLEVLDRGGVPRLRALQLHNGTVYRWNRPCYGVGGGKPHLRIECRVIPAGPSVVDEVANAALWIGAVLGGVAEFGDVRERLSFDIARANFLAAARMGMRAGFFWFDDTSISAQSLLEDELIPLARRGLASAGIDEGDIDYYLGVVEERVRRRATGAAWTLTSLASMAGKGTQSERLAAVTAASAARQREGKPVHEWSLARIEEAGDWAPNYLTVEQYMTTSLYTVNEDELIDLVAFLMDKNVIRHVLVENDANELVGVVSYRSLLRMVAQGKNPNMDPLPVRDVMARDPVTVTPQTPTLEAIELMRERRLSCLPVVSGGKLVGIVTESDFMPIAYQLLSDTLKEKA
ncbi:MAG: glutamate-cysteine ligase family protein [Gemmatimonadota bacterium]